MNKEKKILYLEKTVKSLSSRLETAENEKSALLDENAVLRELLGKMRENMSNLEAQMILSRDYYASKAKELVESKEKYDKAIAEALIAKKEYEKEMEILLKRMRKQN